MEKMMPVPVTHYEGRRLFPIQTYKRLSHSFAFDIYQVEASGPWRSFVREACLPDTGEDVPRAAMWQAYLSW